MTKITKTPPNKNSPLATLGVQQNKSIVVQDRLKVGMSHVYCKEEPLGLSAFIAVRLNPRHWPQFIYTPTFRPFHSLVVSSVSGLKKYTKKDMK